MIFNAKDSKFDPQICLIWTNKLVLIQFIENILLDIVVINVDGLYIEVMAAEVVIVSVVTAVETKW